MASLCASCFNRTCIRSLMWMWSSPTHNSETLALYLKRPILRTCIKLDLLNLFNGQYCITFRSLTNVCELCCSSLFTAFIYSRMLIDNPYLYRKSLGRNSFETMACKRSLRRITMPAISQHSTARIHPISDCIFVALGNLCGYSTHRFFAILWEEGEFLQQLAQYHYQCVTSFIDFYIS